MKFLFPIPFPFGPIRFLAPHLLFAIVAIDSITDKGQGQYLCPWKSTSGELKKGPIISWKPEFCDKIVNTDPQISLFLIFLVPS
jgi:hypothetical protein